MLSSFNPTMDEILPQALAGEDGAERSCQFKGIQYRKWGSWVAEIRMPRSRQKLWLGSYTTAEQAARAFDAVVYCVRGPNAVFNFPDSLPSIPSASSLSPHQIKLAAAKHATLEQPPTISPSAHNNDENANANANRKKRKKAMKDAALPSSSASVQETVLSLRKSGQEEQKLAMRDSLLAESGDCLTWNSERLLSNWEEGEQHHEEDISSFDNFTDLWTFDDV